MAAKKKPTRKKASRQTAGKGAPRAEGEQGQNRAGVATAHPGRDEKGRMLPGHSANPAGRPPGRVSLTTRLREVLCHQAVEDGPMVVEVAMRKLGAAILEDPAGHWQILRWLAEREEGATPQLHAVLGLDPQGAEPVQVIDGDAVTQAQLEGYLAGLDEAQRSVTIAVLAQLEDALPGLVRCAP